MAKKSLKKALVKGTAMEAAEHKDVTKGKKSVAKKIAKAHIEETGPEYYEELPKMEKKLKKGKK